MRRRVDVEAADRTFSDGLESRLIGIGAGLALIGALVAAGYWIGHGHGVRSGMRDGRLAAEELERIRATNLVDAGWLDGYGDYRRLSIDSGRTWYAFDFDSLGRPVILGDMRVVQGTMAARLSAMDAMLEHAARRQQQNTPLTTQQRAILEAAGFGMNRSVLATPTGPDPVSDTLADSSGRETP